MTDVVRGRHSFVPHVIATWFILHVLELLVALDAMVGIVNEQAYR